MKRKLGNKNGFVDMKSMLLGMVMILIVYLFISNSSLFQWNEVEDDDYSTGAIASTIKSWGKYMDALNSENIVLKDRIEVLEHTGYYQAYLSSQEENEKLNTKIAVILVLGTLMILLWALIVMYWYYERIDKFKKSIDKKVEEGLHDYKEGTESDYKNELYAIEMENKRLKTELKIKDKEYELKELKRELK